MIVSLKQKGCMNKRNNDEFLLAEACVKDNLLSGI
jgi:hypothetical protein